jgi:hypothetical protein
MYPINTLFDKNYIRVILAGGFALFLLPVPFSIIPWLTDNGPSWLGVDCSFHMTMNYALNHKFIWGSDLIATYGPLAFLSNRVLWDIPKEYVLFFDLFLLFNFWHVFQDFISRNRSVGSLLVLTLIILLLNVHPGSTTSFIIFFFSIYWLWKDFRKQSFYSLLMSCVCISLCFYMKLNTSIFALLVFITHLINGYIFKSMVGRRCIAALLILCITIYLPSIWLSVDIVAYIIGGLHILSGYNDIMYLNENHVTIEAWVWISYFALQIYFIWQIWMHFKCKEFSKIFYLLLALMYIFLSFKQSMLRNDMQHLYEFSGSAVMVLFLANPAIKSIQKTKSQQIPFAILLVLLLIVKLQVESVSNLISSRFSAPVKYFKDYSIATTNDYFVHANKRQIPQRLLQEIGDETIDIFPWDTQYLLQNKLNYLPRPAFQSYQVYNSFLQNANYESYVHNSPHFIVYDYDAIDNRYPLNEEGITSTFITANYTLSDTFTSNGRLRLLLERNSKVSPVEFTKSKEFASNIHEEIDVSEFDFIKVSLRHHARSKIQSLLYKPSELKIHYILDNGSSFTYKTSPALLESFVHTGKFTENTSDFAQLLCQKNSLKNVVYIKLEDSGLAFENVINIIGYKYDNLKSDIVLHLNYLDFPIDKRHDLFGMKVAALWNGKITSVPQRLRKGNYSISVNAKGTPLDNIYPHVNILVNGRKIYDYLVTGDFVPIVFNYAADKNSLMTITLEIDNDDNNKQTGEDRNLFVKDIEIVRKE